MDEVAIIGAGPTGMTAAVVLADAGVAVRVYEALDDLSTNSRASTFHPPTLELLDTLNVTDDLLDQGLRVDTFQYRSRRHGLVAELDLSVLEGHTRFPHRLQLPQNELTSILRDRLLELGTRISFGHRLTSIEQQDDRVHLHFAGHAAPGEARWVLGADGASSVVRQAVGSEFEGMTYADRFLVVTTPFPFHDAIPGISPVNYISDEDEWLVLLQIPGAWRVLFPVPAEDDMSDAEAITQICQRLDGVAAGAGNIDIDEWSRYAVHQRVATRFREGRVLLAGDAAHVNSPVGGMGMNSGIHDAFAFARGLITVVHGYDTPNILDDIAEQRREYALKVVQVATHSNTRDLSLKDRSADARRDELRALAADRDAMRDHLLATSMITSARPLVASITGGS